MGENKEIVELEVIMKDIKEITGLTKCEFYEFYKDAKEFSTR